MKPDADVDVIEGTNGTTQAAEQATELTDDERKWLATLLSHQQVCALLTSPMDKAFGSNVQTKLEAQVAAQRG